MYLSFVWYTYLCCVVVDEVVLTIPHHYFARSGLPSHRAAGDVVLEQMYTDHSDTAECSLDLDGGPWLPLSLLTSRQELKCIVWGREKMALSVSKLICVLIIWIRALKGPCVTQYSFAVEKPLVYCGVLQDVQIQINHSVLTCLSALH